MFVLSRSIGDSFLIDDLLRVTVILVGDQFAELSVCESDGLPGSQRVVLHRDRETEIAHGVTAKLVQVLAPDRVRLGLEYQAGIAITRAEFT